MNFKIAQPLWIHELGQRSNQEDSLTPLDSALNECTRVFILCDGMGGHEKGEVASQAVCQAMIEWFNKNYSNEKPLSEQEFNQALACAYDALDARDDIDSEKKMGTTMTFLALHAGGATIAHIGDSRIYQIRPSTRQVIYKSRDHSLVYDLIRLGEMTEEEARTSKQKNIITRAMQPNQERRSHADIDLVTDIQAGDYFYLCSDGMLEQMDDQELVSIFASTAMSDDVKRDFLIEKTIDNRDNHTAFIIHVLDVTNELEEDDESITTQPILFNEDEESESSTSEPSQPSEACTEERTTPSSAKDPEFENQPMPEPVVQRKVQQECPQANNKLASRPSQWIMIAVIIAAIGLIAYAIFHYYPNTKESPSEPSSDSTRISTLIEKQINHNE